MIEKNTDADKIGIGDIILFRHEGVEMPAKVTGFSRGRIDVELPAAPEPIPWSLSKEEVVGIAGHNGECCR